MWPSVVLYMSSSHAFPHNIEADGPIRIGTYSKKGPVGDLCNLSIFGSPPFSRKSWKQVNTSSDRMIMFTISYTALSVWIFSAISREVLVVHSQLLSDW